MKKWWKKEILLQVPVKQLQGILRLWSIIHETRAYQDTDQSFARLGHIEIPIKHLQDIGLSVLRLIICKTWTYQDTISHLQDFGHIKPDRSIIRTTWAYQDSNKSSQVIGISVLWVIICKTWAYQFRHDQSFTRLGCVTGYWLGIKYTCTALRYKPAFIVMW